MMFSLDTAGFDSVLSLSRLMLQLSIEQIDSGQNL